MDRLVPRLANEEGSVLIIAIIFMLLLGVFALSMSVLANLEVKIGINHKEAQQALALSEAALEHGRNVLKDALTAGKFDAFVASSSARRLGIPSGGISTSTGTYWVRVDNDCTTPAGYTGSPSLVPSVVQDAGGACSDTVDTNETVVATAWAVTTNGRGRARVRAHYTIKNPWKHSCYSGNGGLCIDDAAGGCNNNPCIDPSDPRNPNGPDQGKMPIPSDIRCGTAGTGTYPPIPASDIPADVAGSMSATAPCVIYPYYLWALKTPAPTRTKCAAVVTTGSGYGVNNCSAVPGTGAWDPANPTCTTPATASKCHGLVFFGPGLSTTTLATGADVRVDGPGLGSPDIRCVGYQNDSASLNCYNGALAQDDSFVLYVLGKVRLYDTAAVQGTVVLHGTGVAGDSDFGLSGVAQVTTRPCTAVVAGIAPGCGYPLAILAYNPNEPAPVTSGQTITLDLSDSAAFTIVSGLIYTGGTADFNPLTVNGGLLGWDVNITNTSTRVIYNTTFGNAAPPPFFLTVPEGESVALVPSTWVHCTNFTNQPSDTSDYNNPSPCQ